MPEGFRRDRRNTRRLQVDRRGQGGANRSGGDRPYPTSGCLRERVENGRMADKLLSGRVLKLCSNSSSTHETSGRAATGGIFERGGSRRHSPNSATCRSQRGAGAALLRGLSQ